MLEEQFWPKVDKSGECWVWTGSKNTWGYGRVELPTGRRTSAHRFAYERVVGPVPKGLVLDHLCRNRACVNPAHLEPVTERVNILRGIGLSAQNAAKTHCVRGHELTGDNLTTKVDHGRPSRKCIACRTEQDAAAYRRRKQRAWPCPRCHAWANRGESHSCAAAGKEPTP